MSSNISPSDTVLELMERAFATLNLKPEFVDNIEQFRATWVTDQGRHLGCTLRLDRANETILATAMLADKIPDAHLPAVVEFATRINYSLTFGSFDVDIEERWIQVRTGYCFRDSVPNETLVANTLFEAMAILTHFLPVLLSVADGSQDAFSAYESTWD